ncbi:hypothetical protein MMSR116_00840 [Methylobacterium mesophilicum SR1.6/6]|uniref:Uncharacterized protein n=1 Tax=Methylobacterium mesophilicum SR1.6/6 TaxID=908290 RepID=A0A6B9FD61_9HYPH|nr:hypothetical protein [Methylobacterium mesophilicum]QGY00612.1 hypothetical protein MMSR116_00840 [Methylobacterium mesophilicum SR1.6/6]
MSNLREKSKINPNWSDDSEFFDEIRPMIDESPIKAVNLLRRFHRQSLKGHHKRVKHTIVHAYACAIKLKKSEKMTKKFYGQDFFLKRKYKLDETNLLRMTMCYIFGSLEGSNYGQALSYERAIRPFFMRQASKDEVAEALSNKSLDKLEQEAKAEIEEHENAETGQSAADREDDPSTNKNDAIDNQEEEDDDEEQSEESSNSNSAPQDTETRSTTAPKREIRLSDLRLVSTDQISLQLFNDPAYKRGSIDYEREENSSGFVRIIVTEVHPKP